MPKICKYCGAELNSDAEFCHKCGKPCVEELPEEGSKISKKKRLLIRIIVSACGGLIVLGVIGIVILQMNIK